MVIFHIFFSPSGWQAVCNKLNYLIGQNQTKAHDKYFYLIYDRGFYLVLLKKQVWKEKHFTSVFL
jgi:hypothetical protein